MGNIAEVNDLIYAGTKQVYDKVGVLQRILNRNTKS